MAILHRVCFHEASHQALCNIETELRTLSRRAQATLESYPPTCEHKLEFIEIAYLVWDTLTRAEGAFRLLHAYKSSKVEDVLRRCLSRLIALSHLPVGDNMVLNGIPGVGKTLILDVLGVVSTCHLPHSIPIYWIYENITTLFTTSISAYSLTRAARFLFTMDVIEIEKIESFASFANDCINDVSATCTAQCVFLFDEFTKLYQQTEDSTSNYQKRLLEEYRAIARNGNVFFALAASHIDVKKYIFRGNVYVDQLNYPDLNNSLFIAHEIHPIRDIKAFSQYWQTQFGQLFSPEQAQKYYEVTGGVGRDIQNYHVSSEIPLFDFRNFISNRGLFQVGTLLCARNSIRVTEVQHFMNMEDLNRWRDERV